MGSQPSNEATGNISNDQIDSDEVDSRMERPTEELDATDQTVIRGSLT